ncbi:MAG: hypothetical protein EOM64_01375 [Erysipelotrichia bacterium]|nr:hypothetical protein [Erysipelotrichia bacterium]
MSATLKIYRCPSCGGDLKINKGDSYVACPYCGKQIAVERDESEKADNLFMEDGTGTPMLTAVIPDGWTKSAHIDNHFQSLGHPLTVWANAWSPDHGTALFYNSGEQFHQIRSGQMDGIRKVFLISGPKHLCADSLTQPSILIRLFLL